MAAFFVLSNEETEREIDKPKRTQVKGGAMAALSVQRLGYGLDGAGFQYR
jgi:hypothetical protein